MSSDCILADETPTARKPHKCDHCLKPIDRGEKYRRIRGVWDGTPGVFKAHIDCEEASRKMHINLVWDEGVLLCSDVEPEDHEWLLAEYPAVAARLGIVA